MTTTDLNTLGLNHESRSRIDELLEETWSLPTDHPLAKIQLQPISSYRLLVLLGTRNKVGSYYFRIFLVDNQGRMDDGSLGWGLFNTGPYPGYNWLELFQYNSCPKIAGKNVDLSQGGLDRSLFNLLCDLIPPGGHLMVEYESTTQSATKELLLAGYHPVLTSIGYLMFQAGCRSFRDWYISEGGNEGPRKLQGNKPPNNEVAVEKNAHLRSELGAFLSKETKDPKTEPLRELATTILAKLKLEV